MRKLFVVATVVCLVSAVAAAQSPQQKCQAGKNQEAGKYAACLAKADARLLKTKGACSITSGSVCYGDEDCPALESCSKDLAKYEVAVQKCEARFEAKWTKLDEKVIGMGDVCPDGLLQEEVKQVLDECIAKVARGLAGEGLDTCGGELTNCQANLATCEIDLGSTEAQHATCESDRGPAEAELMTCEGGLAVCASGLTTCRGELVVALECGDGDIDASEDCDLGNLNGGTCISEGFAGGVLHCGSGCVYDTSECYAARFEDNIDGTITDNDTGLEWEKKVKLDSTRDLANLQDANNVYRWAGWCSINTSKLCQPDAASSATCFAGVEGDTTGCDECTDAEGVCNVASPPGVTIWQWLNALNAANYGGHNDWRIPLLQELMTLVDYGLATSPATFTALSGPSCGGACADVTNPACSCTNASDFDFWTASTRSVHPSDAFNLSFEGGWVGFPTKIAAGLVRAVRSGS